MGIQTYILCPGQGAQHVGMGKDFYEKSTVAKRFFDRANELLGWDLAKLCFEGPEDRLNQTDVSQPAIYVTSVVCYEANRAQDRIPSSSGCGVAGLSLGEYTALHLAGVFTFEDGLKLVAARGRAMQDAAVATPSTMVAVMGASEEQVTSLCAEHAKGEVLVPANFNAPGQIVVSGSKDACARFGEAATAAGFRTVPLAVAGAFHSPIMQPAADIMKGVLDKVIFTEPNTTVFSNVTAQPHTDPASIKALLVDQIVKPVRWEQTMAQLANVAGNQFIELAPGKVLTGLLRKQNRRAEIVNLASADNLTGG
ncbi:MAG: ACP S-malonyltransferase [Tepidisphaeraceae bacterium]